MFLVIKFCKLALSFSMVVFVAGCAFSAVERPDLSSANQPVTASYNLSIEEATKNATSSLTMIGYNPIIAPDGGITTNYVAIAIPENCDCGTWNNKVVTGTADSQFNINFIGEENVRMDLKFTCTATFTATNLYGVPTRSEKYDCASKGLSERAFLDKFNEFLKP